MHWAEHIQQKCPLLQAARQKITSTIWPTAVRLNTQLYLRQQGGTGEDGHSPLADWTLSVAAIEKKNLDPKWPENAEKAQIFLSTYR